MTTRIDGPDGWCPVQATGTVNGHPFYFRSRGDHWTIRVVRIGGDDVGGDPLYFAAGFVGDWPEAGWLSHRRARQIIVRQLRAFRRGVRGRRDCKCSDCRTVATLTDAQRAALRFRPLGTSVAHALQHIRN